MRFIPAFLATVALLLVSCVKEGDDENTGVEAGDMLPAFSVVLDGGETVTTAGLRGKVAVIVFFNTGCNDCRNELPVVQRVYEEYAADAGVAFVAIAREEEADAVSDYWSEQGLTLPFSAQTDRVVYNLFATVGIPRIYIADAGGRITAVFDDRHAPSATALSAVIAAAR